MACIYSYDSLEAKVKEIKVDVENLCYIVDQLIKSENCRDDSRRASFSSVMDQFMEKKHDQSTYEDSKRESFGSYYTAISDLSSDTFISALENLEDEFLEKLDDSYIIEQSMKKTVSFSNNVTILPILRRKCKKGKLKSKLNNVKNKVINYIYQERFLIKYNWQKMKNNILKHKKNINKIYRQSQEEILFCNEILEERNSKTTSVNLQSFFNETVENFILETDIDHDCIPIVSRHQLFPLTDLSTTTFNRRVYSNSVENSIENEKGNQEVKNIEIIKTNFINVFQNESSTKSLDGNILFQYLISKAEYPIQLKVAHSIVKLNIPQWYQSSLIV